MKKFLKVLAAVAAVAAVVPYRGEGDEKGGELEGLLWKATWTRDPDYHSEPDINVTFGFNNPFKGLKKEPKLFADDLVVDYCGEGGITPNTVMYRDEDCTCDHECECKSEEKSDDDIYASAAEGFEEGCCCGDDADDEEQTI